MKPEEIKSFDIVKKKCSLISFRTPFDLYHFYQFDASLA